MRSKRVLRYYCEHCKHDSFTRPSMEAHEKRCFYNPNRSCPLCGVTRPVRELRAILVADNSALDALRKEVAGCPACICAAIAQQSKDDRSDPEYSPKGYGSFDYKTEKANWDQEMSQEHRDACF